MHEPCCHITTKPVIFEEETNKIVLTPLPSVGSEYVLNLATLDLINMTIPTKMLIDTFKSDTLLENKLSILHYLIVHQGDVDTASEVLFCK